MNLNIKKFISVCMSIFMISSLFLLSGCGERENRGYDDSLISSDWYSEKTGRKSGQDYTDEYIKNSGKAYNVASAYMTSISVEDMVQRSSLVIRGRVIGFDYLCIEKAGGGAVMPYTEYYVEILDVLRGEPYNSEVIALRAEGGESDTEILEFCDYEFTVGEEYLLFLWMPSTGGTWFYTEGDYYEVAGYTSYFEANNKTVKNKDGISVPKTFTPAYKSEVNNEDLNYLEFVEKMKEYNELYPVDENYYVKAAQDGLRKNLESGFITQEEYEKGMAGFSKYGTVLYYTEPPITDENP